MLFDLCIHAEPEFFMQDSTPFILVLGTAQDAGYPQLACRQNCCKNLIAKRKRGASASSIAIVDPRNHKWWLVDAGPDLKEQIHAFGIWTNNRYPVLPEAVFLTHAHIGHYSGLMYFGRESCNSKELRVFVMQRMKKFLESSGPWSQLVTLKNIMLMEMTEGADITLSQDLKVRAFQVPHRDEFSETVGFKIIHRNTEVLYIPDIDKWQKWKRNIAEEIEHCRMAFIDATFFSEAELAFRKISEVPHPTVQESMRLMEASGKSFRDKIYFIHLNHTNPLWRDQSLVKQLRKKGFRLAEEGRLYKMSP